MSIRRLPRFRIDAFLLLALCLSIFAIGPLLQPGYFWGAHDAKNSLYFLYEFDKSIQDGILWPRWGPDWGFGYGYPFWNIYGPLAYYVGEAVHLLGFDIVDSVKIVFAISILASALTMYLFARRLLGRRAGLVAALIYVYVPYHLFDVYIRAALAESFSLIFIPLVFWGVFELLDCPRLNAVVTTGFAYAGLVLTSNVLLLLVTPIVILMVIVWAVCQAWNDRRERPGVLARLRRFVAAGIPPAIGLGLGLGLLAAFLLPAVLERRYVRLDQWFGGRYSFGQDFIHVFQLFSPAWGFGASIPGPNDDTGFQLGLVPFVLLVMSFLAVPRVRAGVTRTVLRFWQFTTCIVIFFMTPASAWIWQAFPVLQSVQFPWRLGVLSAVGMAIAGASLFASSAEPGITPKTASTASSLPNRNVSDRPPNQLGALPASNTLMALVICATLIILGSYSYLRAEVREPELLEGPVGLDTLFIYQQSSDEMTGTTAWARRIPGWSVLAEQVVNGGTIDTRVNYTAIPPGDKLGVHSVEMDTVHELVWVYAADDQQSVTFFFPFYPGWTAHVYEDLGEPADDLKARVGRRLYSPDVHTTYYEGWTIVPVPAGEHFVELRFEDTPIRILGKIISFLSLLAAVLAIGCSWLIDRKVYRTV